MIIALPRGIVRLGHGELLRLERARGWTVVCRAGAGTLGIPGDASAPGVDLTLRPARRYVLPSPRPILIEAWGAVELELVPPTRGKGRPGWLGKLAAFMAWPRFPPGSAGETAAPGPWR
ncbi:MAG: hypothetical protein RBS40_06470 [Rhodocyclaceae bacterium]|nr:hypothetical protein [Rhodocyclaceae bacterium]